MNDKPTGALDLINDQLEVEFRKATANAVAESQVTFDFHGATFLTIDAVEALEALLAQRTYH